MGNGYDKKMWEISWDMWENRNGIRLGAKAELKIQMETSEVNAQIHHKYNLGSSGLPTYAKQLFNKYTEKTLKSNLLSYKKKGV